MDPFTLMAIGMGVGAVAKGVGGYIEADTIYTEADKDRREELERLQDLNQLGLTDEEMKVMNEQFMDPLQAQNRQRALERRNIAAAADLGAGAVSRQMMQEQEIAGRQIADVEKQLAAADLATKKQQEEELQGLKKAEEIEKSAKLKAIITGTADTTQALTSAYGQKMAFNEMTGQQNISAQQAQMMQRNMITQQYMNQMYGPQYAPYQQYYNRYYNNPGMGMGQPMPMMPGYPPGYYNPGGTK